MLIDYQKPGDSAVEVCSDLAPADVSQSGRCEAGTLAPNKSPVKLTDCSFIATFDRAAFFHDDHNIYIYECSNGRSQLLYPLSGRKVLSGCVQPDGSALVVTTDSDYILINARGDSGGWGCGLLKRDFSGMPHFTAAPGTPQTCTVPQRTLSRTYADGDEVRGTDARSLSSDLVSAYRRLAGQSAASGDFLQPCVAFYRLLDARGNSIFESPRILIGSPQACSAVTLNFTDESRSAVSSYLYSVTGTRLQLNIPAADGGESLIHRCAASLEVLVSPMLQPYHPSASVDCGRTVGARFPAFALLRLPGAAFGQFSPVSASAPEVVRRIVADESKWRVAAVISDPFGAAAGTVVDILPSALGIETDIADLKATVGSEPEHGDSVECHIRPPHRLMHSLAATASGVTLAAGLSAERFRGFELPAIATTASDSGPWRSVVTTIFNDGSRLSMPAGGTQGAPTDVSPVVTYPSPDVASVAIQLHVQGSPLRVMSLTMRPDATHTRSVALAPGLKPPVWREVDGALAVPEDTAGPLSFEGAVAVCSPGVPHRVYSVVRPAGGVEALSPAARALGAWDFGRARFLCGGPGGINALTVSADRRRVAVNLLDQRPVTHPEAMTAAPDGEVAAVAGTDLIVIKGAAVTTCVSDLGKGRLGWHAPLRQLWHIPDDGPDAHILYPHLKYKGFTAPAHDVRQVITTPDSLFLCVPNAGSVADADADRTVAWRAAFPGPWKGYCRVILPLSATYFNGAVTVSHSHLDADTAVVARFSINGTVHSPLVLPVLTPRADVLRITVAGTASVDFRLKKPLIRQLPNHCA